MVKQRGLMSVVLAVLVGFVGACQRAPTAGDLDALADLNDNGFDDLLPPDGVTFDDATNAKVLLVNTINRDQIGQLAAQQGIDPAALNLVSLEADIVLTLYYHGFETLVMRQHQDLEPFERALEAACPDEMDVDVTVVANVPLVGPQEIYSGVFDLTQGTQYECGGTLHVETSVDDQGLPQVDVYSE